MPDSGESLPLGRRKTRTGREIQEITTASLKKLKKNLYCVNT